jgi:malate dehydrogenase (oxaloacetate-decarboxylating)(NADP+)
MRQRKGRTWLEAHELMAQPRVFAPMMVHMGDADCEIIGLTLHYPDALRPAIRIIKKRCNVQKIAGMYILIVKNNVICCADTTVNIEPTAEELADIALLTAETAKRFDIEPRVAMLSFSNFGSSEHPLSLKVKKATEILKSKAPNLMVDGEMQADTAVVPELIEQDFPFSTLKGGANVLIFPDLQSGNIAYKLLMRIGGAEAIGPILMGLQKSVHVLQRSCEVNDIVNMTAIGVVETQVQENCK